MSGSCFWSSCHEPSALRFMVIFRTIEKIGARGPCDRARVAGNGVWFTT